MAITFTNRKGSRQIRATGKDAQALFDAMCRSVDASTPSESSQNGQKPFPNHPQEKIQGNGATRGASGSQAAGGNAS